MAYCICIRCVDLQLFRMIFLGKFDTSTQNFRKLQKKWTKKLCLAKVSLSHMSGRGFEHGLEAHFDTLIIDHCSRLLGHQDQAQIHVYNTSNFTRNCFEFLNAKLL